MNDLTDLINRIQHHLGGVPTTCHSPLLIEAYEALRNADAACVHSCHDQCQRRGCVKRRRIAELETAIRETLEQNAHLADGDNCTLKELKRAMR